MTETMINTKEILTDNEATMHVKIRGVKQFGIRVFIARQLLCLAAWIMWHEIQIKFVEDEV